MYYITEENVLNSDKVLTLFNFDEYIIRNKLKEVKNSNLLSLNDKNSFDAEG